MKHLLAEGYYLTIPPDETPIRSIPHTPSSAVRAEGEHDRIGTLHRAGKRVGSGDVTDDHLRFGGKLTRLVGVAHQGTHGMALPDRFSDDEAPDAAGRTDDQHGHAGNGHDVSLLFGVPA